MTQFQLDKNIVTIMLSARPRMRTRRIYGQNVHLTFAARAFAGRSRASSLPDNPTNAESKPAHKKTHTHACCSHSARRPSQHVMANTCTLLGPPKPYLQLARVGDPNRSIRPDMTGGGRRDLTTAQGIMLAATAEEGDTGQASRRGARKSSGQQNKQKSGKGGANQSADATTVTTNGDAADSASAETSSSSSGAANASANAGSGTSAAGTAAAVSLEAISDTTDPATGAATISAVAAPAVSAGSSAAATISSTSQTSAVGAATTSDSPIAVAGETLTPVTTATSASILSEPVIGEDNAKKHLILASDRDLLAQVLDYVDATFSHDDLLWTSHSHPALSSYSSFSSHYSHTQPQGTTKGSRAITHHPSAGAKPRLSQLHFHSLGLSPSLSYRSRLLKSHEPTLHLHSYQSHHHPSPRSNTSHQRELTTAELVPVVDVEHAAGEKQDREGREKKEARQCSSAFDLCRAILTRLYLGPSLSPSPSICRPYMVYDRNIYHPFIRYPSTLHTHKWMRPCAHGAFHLDPSR